MIKRMLVVYGEEGMKAVLGSEDVEDVEDGWREQTAITTVLRSSVARACLSSHF